MVARCVSVFFLPASVYLQYRWHLPGDHSRYSVLLPEDGVRVVNVSSEETIRRIPLARMRKMQEEVVKIVPRLVYVDRVFAFPSGSSKHEEEVPHQKA